MQRIVAFFAAFVLSQSVASAQQPCTTDARRVVDELYRHILERPADASSASHVQRLTSGSATVRDLVRDIAKSPEHQQRFFSSSENDAYFRAVGTLYRHVLGRQADPGGARNFANVAASRGFGEVVDQLVGSAEYQQSFGDNGVPGSGGLQYCGGSNGFNTQTQNTPTYNQDRDMRFAEMDRNNDGVIALREWQGSRQSFNVHDWNRDGVLSGDEVRAGAFRNDRSVGDENFDRADRFDDLDANGNGRIERREWHGSADAFNWLDRNNDGLLSRAELADNGSAAPRYGQGRYDQGSGPRYDQGIGTSGQIVRVDPAQRWTDTGISVRAGDTVSFDAEGNAQLSTNPNDIAGPGGSVTRRRANNAPLPQRAAGALIARVGNSAPMFVGARGSIEAPVTGRLYVGVNDDYLQDNTGEYRVTVNTLSR